MISAKIIEDSISPNDIRLTTMQLCYPRFIHSEFMTHRVFSRNASSSRAIPVEKTIKQVLANPAMPVHWGKNQPGMQAREELDGVPLHYTRALWIDAATAAADIAQRMADLGAHKQIVNRILEPFQLIHVVVTATEWDNFFALRMHEDAQPEIHELARVMKIAMLESTPKRRGHGHWHLPYVTEEDRAEVVRRYFDDLTWAMDILRKISAARCCRVSYLKHDGGTSTIEEDLALCERLAGADPIHASPFEHQGVSDWYFKHSGRWERQHLHGNLRGWVQHRKLLESGEEA